MEKTKSFDALPASKADIRQFMLAKRNAISKKQIKSKSSAIAKKLFSMPEFKRAKTIFTYISFGSEVDTKEIIKKSLSLGKTVAVPVADFKKKNLTAARFSSFSRLKKSRFGVPEPDLKKSMKIAASQIDLVIVPGVAFDVQCNRIGYGKGFYDTFLAKNPHIKNVGLAFGLQVLKKIPATKKDRKVMKVVTEKRIVK
jgi:5-formyltetrahydrofolate cyclo-ligase